MARESYFFFIVWSVLGSMYFRRMLRIDKAPRFGKSNVVRIALFSLALFVWLAYLCQPVIDVTSAGLRNVEQFNVTSGGSGVQVGVMGEQVARIRIITGTNVTTVVGLIALSLYVRIGNFRLINERAISGGLAVYDPGADVRLRPLFEQADAAMYRGKTMLKGMGAQTRQGMQINGGTAKAVPPLTHVREFAVIVVRIHRTLTAS